jgi:signal transduction histidine kinase
MVASGPAWDHRTAVATREHVRLTRSRTNRVLVGVCGGVARALGVDPLIVRVAAVALAFAGGAGVIAYAAGWLLLPREGEEESLARSAHRASKVDPAEALAIGSIVLGVVLLVRATGVWFSDAVVWPVALAGFGLAVIWRQADDAADEESSAPRLMGRFDVRSRRVALARVVAGVVLVVGGVSAFLAASNAFSAVRQAVLATAGIVTGLAIISGPWWLRLGRELARERRERIRSEERAEMAAHLHDSVLQTLALIQRTADDPRAVVAMARRQERELRGWLYETNQGPAAPDTLAAALARIAEEVEGLHGVRADVVTVGDCPMDERLHAMLAAAREALVNAAKWSGAETVSVYGEVRDSEVSVFVRDWGEGFDPDAVGPDHHGIRDSIKGRMARHGGTAIVRATPGEGTEVQLRMSRAGVS